MNSADRITAAEMDATSASVRTVFLENYSKLSESLSTALEADVPKQLSGAGTAQFYAVVKRNDRRDDIVPLDTIPIRQLYPELTRKALLWAKTIGEILEKLSELDRVSDEEPYFQAGVTIIWGKIIMLKEFLGVSSGHNQIISALLTVFINHGKEHMNSQRMRDMRAAFCVLENRVHLTDKIVDQFEDALDDHGFDHLPTLGSDLEHDKTGVS